jgi:arylsulfatase A-like enzyme
MFANGKVLFCLKVILSSVKYFLLVTGLISLLFTGHTMQAQAKKSGTQKPNILCILVDDLGFADLSGIRVPMCAVWPGKIAAGSQTVQLNLTMDLFPTFCEAAGINIPASVDGISFLPALFGQNQPLAERELVWMRREGTLHYNGQDYYAIRTGNWKLVQNHPFRPLELYNLAEAPWRNVIWSVVSGKCMKNYRKLCGCTS